jgi:hypothetical protein
MTTQNHPGMPVESGYIPVNGLEMYYEIHGSGRPLVLLHGNLVGLPRSQLAMLPGTTHVTLVDRSEWLASMITAFLDAPMPETT